VRVFLSSTYQDLIDERNAVAEALAGDFEVLRMEDFGSRDEVPIETCLQAVESSDVYILIVGHRYGTIHSEYQLSYTHIEHERAMECRIPVLAFVKDGIDHAIEHAEPDEAVRLGDFRKEIERAHTVRRPYFNSPAMLAEDVLEELRARGDRLNARPFFGRRSAAIDDTRAYGVGEVRRTRLRIHPLVIHIADVSVLSAIEYPASRGRRMREKVQRIVAVLDREGASWVVFNEIPATGDDDVIDQRLREVATGDVLVCLVRGEADLENLERLLNLGPRTAVWYPDRIDVDEQNSIRFEAYSEVDMQECALARRVSNFLSGVVDEHLAATLTR
jgi:hypothetical protein